MDCQNSAKMMTDLLAGELDAAAKKELMDHINACEPCRKEYEELTEIWSLTEKTLKSAKLSESLAPQNYKAIFEAAKPRVPWFKRLLSGIDLNMDIFSMAAMRRPLVQVAVSVIAIALLAALLLPNLSTVKMKSRKAPIETEALQDEIKSPGLQRDRSAVKMKELQDKSCAVPLGAAPAAPIAAYSSIEASGGGAPSGVNAPAKQKLPALRKAPAPKAAANEQAATQMMHYESVMKKDREAVAPEPEAKGVSAPVDLGEARLQAAAPAEIRMDVQHMAQERKGRIVSKTFDLDLKLWDMNTADDAAKLLKSKGVDVQADALRIVTKNGKRALSITASEPEMEEAQEIIDDLKAREEEQRKFHDGLPMLDTKLKPVSTFSLDVDTASYTIARKLILDGRRPDPESVRPEEFINYFDYHYKSPEGGATVSVQLEAAPSPFRPGNVSFRVGVQSRKLGPDAKRPSSFTILVDSSGSMAQRNRLDLAKSAVRMLAGQLKANDTISLLAGGATPETLLDHVPAGATPVIDRAVARISPGGSTDLGRCIAEAYRLAAKNYKPGGFNRVVIFTDGIGGLGEKSAETILRQVETARAKGIGNTVVGVGGDGDSKFLESLADKGDGQYIFLDAEEEAQEVFAEQFAAKFRTVAKDVKAQVEFNPALVARYRQIGYKNRQLSKDEFRDDKVDAGELGAGQSATAIYELQLQEMKNASGLRQTPFATVRIRYQLPDTQEVQEREFTICLADIKRSFAEAAGNFKLACSIAEFAERLRYPDTPAIANPGAIKDILKTVLGGAYSDDAKVKEAAALLDAIK